MEHRVGDFLQRLVARSLAQSFATRFLDACQPFQFALSARAGTEAVAHALLVATESRPDATILSVDGVGTFDTISRQAMLQALSSTPGANVCLPFVRQFYSDPSRFVWHDADGQAHLISQAEGGEQGDPLMPALFALGQHAALAEVRRQLRPDECLLATSPERTRVVFDLLSLHLHRHAHIQLHRGKTRVWNASGLEPPGIRELGSVSVGRRPGLAFGPAGFAGSRISSSKASARSLTYSPLGCCFCSVPLPGAPMFCVRCRPWPCWLLPSPMMRLSPHVLCCGSVRDWPPSRLCPPDCPASFPARRSQPAVWRCASPGCVLGVVGRHAARAASPAPNFGRGDPSEASCPGACWTCTLGRSPGPGRADHGTFLRGLA